MYQTFNQEGWARWAEFQCLGSSVPAKNDGVQLGIELCPGASATSERAKQCHLRPGLTYSWQANGQRKVTSQCLNILSACEGMENEQRQSGMGCCVSLW